jgi:hypothetical protein
MPSATIARVITPQEAAEALRGQLGTGYRVTPNEKGTLKVHRGAGWATVHLRQDATATTFRVHGGGLIIGRIINELGIARTVTTAIKDSLGSAHAD